MPRRAGPRRSGGAQRPASIELVSPRSPRHLSRDFWPAALGGRPACRLTLRGRFWDRASVGALTGGSPVPVPASNRPHCRSASAEIQLDALGAVFRARADALPGGHSRGRTETQRAQRRSGVGNALPDASAAGCPACEASVRAAQRAVLGSPAGRATPAGRSPFFSSSRWARLCPCVALRRTK
jgi:hypothetical protein